MDPVVIVLGLGIGTLVGMTGMGGASLMTPLLILVVGTSPVTAIGTDIFYGAITKTVGGWQHLKKYTVHLGLVLWLAVGSVPAALAGRQGDRGPAVELRRRHRQPGRARHGRRRPPGGRRGDADPLAVPARRHPRSRGDAPLPQGQDRRGDHRRHHRLHHRPDLGRQRDADRDRPHRRLPRSRPGAWSAPTSSTPPCCCGRRASPTGSAATSTSPSPATSSSARSRAC